MAFKWFIILAVFWMANAEERVCEINVSKIQNLMEKATAFRERYNFGMENKDQNDPIIEESFVKKCVVEGGERCCLTYVVSNSTYNDYFHGCYKVGDKPEHIKNGHYGRRRRNDVTWYFDSNEQRGFFATTENDYFSKNNKTFDLNIHSLVGDYDVMMSQVSHLSDDKQDFLRDLFTIVQRVLNFYHNLSDEDKKLEFGSDYNNNRRGSVNNYESIDDDEEVFLETLHDGSQLGEYQCEKVRDGACVTQKFIIESGNIVLHGESRNLERCFGYSN